MLEKLLHLKKSNQKGIGGRGEDIAVAYLRKKKYKIRDQNWYNKKGRRCGEIDIIAQKKGRGIIFVEVKTRHIAAYSENLEIQPEDQITPNKLRKVHRTAQIYVAENVLWDVNWSFDAIAVLFFGDGHAPIVRHLKNIFY